MIACIAVWLVEMNIVLFGTVVSRRRFEEVLPLALIGPVLWTYVFGLFGALYAGLVTALAGGVLLGALATVLVCLKKRTFSAARFFTPAFFAYLVLLALAAYISFGRVAANWDECSHWGTVVKAMSSERAFSTNPACHILFRAYPPGAAVYQYFYQAASTFFTGEAFSEWLLFFGYDAFCLALLMPPLRFITKKPWLYTPLAAALLACLPLCWYDAMYASLYIDGLLAVLAFYAFYCLRFESRGSAFDMLSCCTTLAMLTLVKDAGLFFAILAPLIAFLSGWMACGRRAWRLGALWPYVACGASVALAKWSWTQEVARSGVRVLFSEPVDLTQLIRILSGAETGYQHTILVNYVKKFFSPALSIGPVSVSFCMIFLALAALSVALLLLTAKRSGEKKRVRIVMLAPLWADALYILGLGVLYLFKFGEYEGINLASYARYIKIGFILWSLMIAAEWLRFLFTGVKRPLPPLAISCGVIVLGALMVSTLPAMLTRQSAAQSAAIRAEATAGAALVEERTEADARTYVLTQALDGYEYYQLRYLLYPRVINEGAFSIGEPFYDGDIWTHRMSAEAWRDTLLSEGYQYVLVYRANDFLNTDFAEMFPTGARDGVLYRVSPEGTLVDTDGRDGGISGS